MRTSLATLVLAASLVQAAPASAQTQQHFTFVNGGNVTAYGYSVGPYQGLMGYAPTQQNVILNCVDFFHHISPGQQWNANLSSLSTGLGIGSATRSSSISLYKEAAYLTTLYSTSGINTKDEANIQISIWNLFQNTNLNYVSGGTKTGSYWLNLAQSNYASMNTNGWYVVTDVNKSQSGSAQEFLMYNPNYGTTATPEPASLALFGTGLVTIALVRRRRRKAS